STSKRSLTLFLVERAAARAFGAMLAQDHVLVRREPLAPIHIRKLAIVDSVGGGHSLCPAKSHVERERRKGRTSSQQGAPIVHWGVSLGPGRRSRSRHLDANQLDIAPPSRSC